MDLEFFLDASNILLHTQVALPEQITPKKSEILQRVADVLRDVETIIQAKRLGRQTPELNEFLLELSLIRSTILIVADGGTVPPKEVVEAVTFCNRVALVIY